MTDATIVHDCYRAHDLAFDVDSGNAFLVDKFTQEGQRVARIHARRIGRNACRQVRVTDDRYTIDDNRLTYYHAGRFKQLSQFGGKVINELIA